MTHLPEHGVGGPVDELSRLRTQIVDLDRALSAIRAGDGAVLLVDELDRADEEFESFLLELLSDFQITIPELGTLRAAHRPLVLLTSNRTREVHDALKRRCLYHWIEYPTAERAAEIAAFEEGGQPDFEIMDGILHYCRSYPDRHHHPCEDLVYEVLQRRNAPAAAAVG